MKTVEIKKKLIDEINLSENKDLLKELYSYLNKENEVQFYELSKGQKSAIEEARRQIENGEYYTDEEGNEEIERWLNK